MTEAGPLGAACARGSDATDVHVLRDKISLLQRMQMPTGGDEPIGVFFLTALLATGPKILINVASDDFGILEERNCGCPLGDLGLHQHLRRIRSAGKLTGRWASQLDAARQPHERNVCGIQSRYQHGRRLIVRLFRVAPRKRETIAPRKLDDPQCGLG